MMFTHTLKWGGAVVTVLLLVVWIGSGWWLIGWRFASGGSLCVLAGKLGVVTPAVGQPVLNNTSFLFDRHDFGLGWWFDWVAQPVFQFYAIPLWLPALASLLVTAAAWRVDAVHRRRARVGACSSCGYDRAGLAPGSVCPECGAAAHP